MPRIAEILSLQIMSRIPMMSARHSRGHQKCHKNLYPELSQNCTERSAHTNLTVLCRPMSFKHNWRHPPILRRAPGTQSGIECPAPDSWHSIPP